MRWDGWMIKGGALITCRNLPEETGFLYPVVVGIS
jgi:hypothetical protein